jgi:ParB family chromosome partitioning protein
MLSTAAREFLIVSLDVIDEPAMPSRSAMDEDKLDQLAESIRSAGLLQPMILARVGDRYEVIAGHRRWHACKRAGLAQVPAIVFATKDDALTIAQAHENTRREELNPADEAIWFAELLDKRCDNDIEKLCALVGEKRSYVDNRLVLFYGDPAIFAALQAGKIKIGVAHELNKCTDAHYRQHFLHMAIESGATIAVVSGMIADWKRSFVDVPQPAAGADPSTPSMHVEFKNPFTCYVCGRTDNVHLMSPLQVHQHCRMAILDPILHPDPPSS